MKKDAKGFTLIELLLVVAILAFLIAIIVVASGELSKNSKKKSMYASLKTLKVALETYYIQQTIFPPDGADWDLPQPALLQWAEDQPRTIDSIPKDIFEDGTPRVSYDLYDTAGDKLTYVAWSVGPNKGQEISGALEDNLNGWGSYVDDIFVTNAYGKIYEK